MVPATLSVVQPTVNAASAHTRNEDVVAAPFADTVAFKVTPVLEMVEAASVVTLGAPAAEVVNDRVVPFVVPAEFTPTAR